MVLINVVSEQFEWLFISGFLLPKFLTALKSDISTSSGLFCVSTIQVTTLSEPEASLSFLTEKATLVKNEHKGDDKRKRNFYDLWWLLQVKQWKTAE